MAARGVTVQQMRLCYGLLRRAVPSAEAGDTLGGAVGVVFCRFTTDQRWVMGGSLSLSLSPFIYIVYI